MTEKERMLSGKLYIPQGEEIIHDYQHCKMLLEQINTCPEVEWRHRNELFRTLFGSLGEGFWIAAPFHCDYGRHIRIGDGFAANYDCIIIDVCPVTIGNHVLLGPRVGIYTAAHPIDAGVRNARLEYGKPIQIGNDVWIGGNAIINPGVTIGNNVVIGSGSVVTQSIPDNVVAVGNPCRVLRPITKEDQDYWQGLRREYEREMV
jgi:maltose O-acetyltransferase